MGPYRTNAVPPPGPRWATARSRRFMKLFRGLGLLLRVLVEIPLLVVLLAAILLLLPGHLLVLFWDHMNGDRW